MTQAGSLRVTHGEYSAEKFPCMLLPAPVGDICSLFSFLDVIVVYFINNRILTAQTSPCLFTKRKTFLLTTIILEFCALF